MQTPCSKSFIDTLLGDGVSQCDAWETFYEKYQTIITDAYSKNPKITVIDENWQRSKCAILRITFDSVSKHSSDLVGQPLSKYEPELTENIKGDGNCLLRCLSK